MSEDSAIAWTDHTFNPWWGCTRVSPGCTACYAEAFAHRYGFDVWGPGRARRTFGEKHWREPLRWNARAAAAGIRERVFCASMADVCDVDAPPAERDRLWDLIDATPSLDWLLLTKRPERYLEVFPARWDGHAPENVWLGTTVEDQRRAEERIPVLAAVPAHVRFLSVEPLLERVDLGLLGTLPRSLGLAYSIVADRIDLVIVGGESGAKARPFDLAWARAIQRECREASTAFFMKQLGSRPVGEGAHVARGRTIIDGRWISDRAGADPAEWPEDLRIREMPRSSR